MYDIEQDVENVARVYFTSTFPRSRWEDIYEETREAFRVSIRAALNASTAVKELKYSEKLIKQMQDGCDGKCAIDECLCTPDSILQEAKEELKELQERYDTLVKDEWQPIDEGAMTGDYILVKHMIPYPDHKPHVTVFDSDRQKFDMGSMRQPDFYRLITPPKKD